MREPSGLQPAGVAFDIPSLASELASGRLTARRLAEASLSRYRETEPSLQAFTWIDPNRILESASKLDAQSGDSRGRLAGIPIGVKDIFDTAGIPTEHGSALFAGRVPDVDADVVAALNAARGIMFGKTVTTELAYFEPGRTKNPWNPTRTPGGSSMGSAAAVAAGVVAGSIASQTNGSVIRPAAFCGVVGLKPTIGWTSTQGALSFSPSLDTVGVMARSVSSAAWLAAALSQQPVDVWMNSALEGQTAPILGVVKPPEWLEAEPAMRAQFEHDIARIRGTGIDAIEVDLPRDLADSIPVHRTIMAVEAFRSLGGAVGAQPNKASAVIRALLEEGSAIPAPAYEAALQQQEKLRETFAVWIAPFDAVVTIPALGEAPTPETTGDPRCCTRWTLLGAPALTLPTGLGPHGLPLGLQVVAGRNQDRRLLTAALQLEKCLPFDWNSAEPRSRSISQRIDLVNPPSTS